MKWITNFSGGLWFKGIILALMFSAGCTVTLWYKNSEIKDMKLEYSQQEVTNLKTAAASLAEAADSINLAAKTAQTNTGVANAKLDALSKQIKGFKALPDGCVPDSQRVLNLKDSIDLSNTSRTR